MDDLQMAILKDKVWAVKTAMMASGFLTLVSALLLIQGGSSNILVLFLVVFVMYGVMFVLFYMILMKKRMKMHAQLYTDMLEKINKGKNK
jgi:hypothetical protein